MGRRSPPGAVTFSPPTPSCTSRCSRSSESSTTVDSRLSTDLDGSTPRSDSSEADHVISSQFHAVIVASVLLLDRMHTWLSTQRTPRTQRKYICRSILILGVLC